MKSIRTGVVGISGYGGGETLRYLVGHPRFELIYAAGESSAGAPLGSRFPTLSDPLAGLVIEKFDPDRLPSLDLLFASLPTGQSRELLARVPASTRVVD
jgi:N-acetyl-gamma-glutamyl-phosphate reductase